MVAKRAQELLRVLAGQQATLRDDQLAAIQALVVDRRRVVVVKRTGWGKSAVYFLATRLLRDAGAGPTLLVSPLLSLMRDQIAKAEAIGIRAATINSTNLDQWRQVEAELAAGRCRPAADLARAAQQPPVPHPGPARPVRQGGAAGD